MKKFTNLNEELSKDKENFSKIFNENYQNSLNKVDQIKIKLDDLAVKQSNNISEWEYIDILKVNSIITVLNQQLDDILKKLTI